MKQPANKNRNQTRMSAQQALKLSKKMTAASRAVVTQLGSIGEETLARHLQVNGIKFVREYEFHPKRKYRADFYIAEQNLLIEVEGGTKSKSRHTTHEGYSQDLLKYNLAQILGYSRLAFTTDQVKSGMALQMIKKFIHARSKKKKIFVPVQPNAVIKKIINGELKQ